MDCRRQRCRHPGCATPHLPIRRLGLCSRCYYRKEVRRLYKTQSIYGMRGVPDFEGRAPRPRRRTEIPPGEARVKILEERAALGLELWKTGMRGDAQPDLR